MVIVLSDAKADRKFSHIYNWRVSNTRNIFIVITNLAILIIIFIIIISF